MTRSGQPNGLDRVRAATRTPILVPQRLTAQDWIWAQIPEPDFLLGEVFSTTTRGLLSAPTGLGKTMLSMAIALAMSEGRDFLHWRARRDGPAKVLFVDGEMSERQTKRRLTDALRRAGFDTDSADLPEHFRLFCLDELPMRPPPLNTPEGQEYFDRVITDEHYDFIFFDNIQALLIGNMADSEPWADVLPWTYTLTKRAIGQLWVDHTGHNTTRAYGTATKAWTMDINVLLEETECPWADVATKLKFLKARERTSENRADFEPAIITLERGQWFAKPVESLQTHEVAPLPKSKPPSPQAVKFYDALSDACIDGKPCRQSANHPAVTQGDWDRHLIRLNLIDSEKSDKRRALTSKYKRELLAANWIGANGELIWCIQRRAR